MKEMKPQYIYKATVQKVVDGDTVDLLIDCGFNILRTERIRFYGVVLGKLVVKKEKRV